MNKFEKEIKNYISGTERMSGFDSYDSAEGDMSYFDDSSDFDGDGMSYSGDDAMSFASGSANVGISDPYVIQYQNTTTNDETAILFGYNDYFGSLNYGNPTAIVITNLQGGTYGRLIAQSNNKFFKIGKWRFQSISAPQLQQTLTINHVDANGKSYTVPLNLSIMRDAYQQQSDIIDVTKPVTVDGNTFITFTLKASTTFVISMFPVAVLSGKAKLNGGSYDNTARAPRLSGKNVAPVIIQTSQSVKGIQG
tara:strand:- start:161 stop:913 length:753 start_codon:yes stop_codon:yes gene_type:complete